jgi:hypothetical protein
MLSHIWEITLLLKLLMTENCLASYAYTQKHAARIGIVIGIGTGTDAVTYAQAQIWTQTQTSRHRHSH